MRGWVPGFEGGCPERAGWRCAPCISSSWSFTTCPYFHYLRIFGWRWNDPFSNYFGKAETRWSIDRSAANVLEMGVWECLIWRATRWETGLLRPLAERLAYQGRSLTRDMVWGYKVRDVFLRLESNCDGKLTKIPKRDFIFARVKTGQSWHLIPYRISPRSEFFSQAYKTWHIPWGINLGPDWPPLARGSKFHTIHTPTRPLSFLPLDNRRYGPIGFSRNNIIL